ncbi:MAG: type VI secretion system baseplate subunit TssG [Planctomycetes bacterium]|nr:type VI secretion system baseplate subunit TssG [Planctomycetota bacterium]
MSAFLVERLLRDGRTWDFVQAVAAIEEASPGCQSVGTGPSPAKEAVRFRPELSLAFPSSDIAGIQRLPEVEGQRAKIRVETTFMGVYGQASPLPPFATEMLMPEDAAPARDFLDIFHHRILSLAYRVLTKYRVDRSREHEARLRAFIGASPDLPLPQLPGEGQMLAIAGLLSQQPRSAAALAAALGAWLGGVPVAIEQCAPTWTPLPAERQGRLGSANCGAGTDCLAGERILSRTTAFRVHVGPVGADDFRRFLPGGDGMAAVTALVAEFNSDLLDWDVQVRLAPDALPPASLGEGARLGWDTRLEGPPPDDASILITT